MGPSKELRWLDGGDKEMVDYSFTPSLQPASYKDAIMRFPSPFVVMPVAGSPEVQSPAMGPNVAADAAPHQRMCCPSWHARQRRAHLLRAAVPPARPPLPELASTAAVHRLMSTAVGGPLSFWLSSGLPTPA